MVERAHPDVGRQDWRHHAACRDSDPELFFPTATTGEVYDAQVAAAKAVCGRCRVQAPCLTDALTRIPDGVAGGLSEEERRALRACRRSVTSDPNEPAPEAADPEPERVPVEPARYGRAPRAEVAAAAVGLVEAGRAAGVVAGLVGVSERTVTRWVAQARAALTEPTEDTEPAEQQEVGA